MFNDKSYYNLSSENKNLIYIKSEISYLFKFQ